MCRMTEEDLGPEPEESETEEWYTWCIKTGVIRYARHKDAVEICACHLCIYELRQIIGTDATNQFLDQVFSPEEAKLQYVEAKFAPALARNRMN